jgi:hypothetical protein
VIWWPIIRLPHETAKFDVFQIFLLDDHFHSWVVFEKSVNSGGPAHAAVLGGCRLQIGRADVAAAR